ncbi:MAG: hypothetical protein OCD76_19435 [Reichenbachiella sp.]
MNLDQEAIRIVLSKMPDGFLFEGFAQKIFNIVFGDTFIPVGGSGDQGIDGFQCVYSREEKSKLIYQISTEEVHWKQKDNKITSTKEKLDKNGIEYDKLSFITNRKVLRKDTIQDEFYDRYDFDLTIYDQEWFINKILSEPSIADIYLSFIQSHVHEYNQPSKLVEVGEFSSDPRLYVFLRQQVDENSEHDIESNILDGLILYVLEGTASEKGIFKDLDQIIIDIREISKFSISDLKGKINSRLLTLSKIPYRKVKHHTVENHFCLPYETRIELTERDIKDAQLQSDFETDTLEIIKENLELIDVKVKDVYSVFEQIIHGIFYRQGLEFSDFVLNDSNKGVIDDSLSTIVAHIVDDTSIKIGNKYKVKRALLLSIREIVYNGNSVQREFLRRLSKTYLMFFLTQNDPKISLFFKSLANRLDVFVGTSIIVPALSEYYLDDENKRYWNLIKGAKQAGVNLWINEYIIDELVSHITNIKDKYLGIYQPEEDDYLKDDIQLLYIDEILIRAYFYAKKRGRVTDFDSFLIKFVDPNLSDIKEDLIFFLNEMFGIEYIPTSSQDIKLDPEELNLLIPALTEKKQNSVKRATVDAKLILHIYKLREQNNETNTAGIFGYKTWWLSQDVNTFKTVKEVLDKYTVSCYMRADFLYKYISLAPKRNEIDALYKKCFPNLMGVNLSYHLPPGISDFVAKKIAEHKDTNPLIVKRTLKKLTEKLMSSMENLSSKDFKDFFEEELEKQTKK